MRYWLMKSEPDAFSIDDLASRPDQREPWDGIRNYQARNYMRDDMRVGDKIFFYHSRSEPPAVVGIMKVASKPYADPTQFDPESKYYDPKSTPEEPRWQLVDVQLVRKLKREIPLQEIKRHADQLEGLPLIAKGSRLSVMPIEKAHWDFILQLEKS